MIEDKTDAVEQHLKLAIQHAKKADNFAHKALLDCRNSDYNYEYIEKIRKITKKMNDKLFAAVHYFEAKND